ncbi:cobalt-precorrin-5B (C(1))-methyltransferase [Synechococcus sp. ATX 2A4]|uniref:cobalt-precorrin-5B (C(1))-methyltransferase CbiD n=1 Tax=Synechococcus sp. ATX 2A4 TaxID=2823727 RepID=UPI0020CC06FD|nr:cobalt-precorrin-5B (C(1))-methyltransferase CbiD [Synechococcus sp. ATX 2A4]MCP9885433.1 cobalt-precorrin-5B (C(1))-methyltransferase [Synechococcus sp. ATX 2A4]
MVKASSGYTLPVWVAAAACAAVRALDRGEEGPAAPFEGLQALELLEPPGVQQVPVEAAAPIGPGRALGISRCDPGAGLDLTRGLAVWVVASWIQPSPADAACFVLEPGEGVGVHGASGDLCASAYARAVLEANLRPLVGAGRAVRLRLVLPEGRALALRTSNAAFGVVDGLALIGTQAEVQRSAAPDQLQACLAALAARTATAGFAGDLVLVIGENGLDLAPSLGLPGELLLKAGNWLGPVLVAAGEAGVCRLLLFGYHGKLIKLAGGIFHTHHHLADGRAEVLTALAALEGLSGAALARLHAAATVEAALSELAASDPALAQRLERRIATAIEQRSMAYLARYGSFPMIVGAALFDRRRQLRVCGPQGQKLLEAFRHPLG